MESGNDALISELIFEKVEIIETATEEGITLTVAQYDVEEADAFIAFYNEEQKLLFCEFVTLDTKDEEKSVTISSSRIGEAASYKVIILENDDNGHWMPLMSLYQKEL